MDIISALLKPKTKPSTKTTIKASATRKPAEVYFEGLSGSQIDQIAKTVSRGVGAETSKDSIVFIYKSASGETKNRTRIVKENGELIHYKGCYWNAGSPDFFYDKLVDAIKKKRKKG